MDLAIYEEAKQNKEPLYLSGQGYAVEVWPYTEKIYVLVSEELAKKLGIDNKAIIGEVLE